MSRKDYVAIAAIFRAFDNSSTDERTLSLIRDAIADHLARDNPSFDRARFIAAATGPRAR